MKILLIDSKLQHYSFNDVLEHFQNNIKHESIKFTNYNPGIGYGVEDIEQELRIVLYDSYNKYNDTSIHFSTYFYQSVRNHLINILRRYQTQKRVGRLTEDSLDRELFDDSGSTLLEQQQSSKDTESEFFAHHVIGVAYSVAHTSLDKDIINYFLDGITVWEIATKHNVSRRAVYDKVDKIRKKLQILLK